MLRPIIVKLMSQIYTLIACFLHHIMRKEKQFTNKQINEKVYLHSNRRLINHFRWLWFGKAEKCLPDVCFENLIDELCLCTSPTAHTGLFSYPQGITDIHSFIAAFRHGAEKLKSSGAAHLSFPALLSVETVETDLQKLKLMLSSHLAVGVKLGQTDRLERLGLMTPEKSSPAYNARFWHISDL